ncbi:acyl carrier protein [Cognatiyoonia sp. IB215182]|uniref:acyl carrier protein n=1 Tax=Cognatiyoonia sp. IB215182 TaxID=3097353 RepID=UPI002A14EB96|nr:acyl carrier protein [Cognatiyoonia sp. IB215182]MDX8354942.1 acyl carrier protein [Cognatiyoonia sp. IB215182]
MTDDPIHHLLVKHLGQIAPDIPFDEVDPQADLRDEFDIDSMDFMTLITALGKALSLPMPEADYDQMRSFDDLADYLRSQTARGSVD